MVDDAHFDKAELTFEQYALTPKPEHVTPSSVLTEQRRQAFRRKLAEEPSVVILTHDDADGLSSAALVAFAHQHGTKTAKEFRDFGFVVETIGYEGAFTLVDALSALSHAEHTPNLVYILDFNFGDDHVALDALRHHVNPSLSVRCFDHHQWENAHEVDAIDGVQLYVDDDECTATLLLRELFAVDVPQRLETLAQVTKDYDLWIREDPRSGRLQTFSKLAEPGEYIDTVLTHGVDFPEEIDERIDEQEQENEQLVELGVERAEVETVGGLEVAHTYLGKGPSAEVGNELVEAKGNDIALVMKGHGGAGLYSHSNEEGFTRCHEVAETFGGGGHPTAAGFGFDFESFLDLAAYWGWCGAYKHYDVYDAIMEVVDDG